MATEPTSIATPQFFAGKVFLCRTRHSSAVLVDARFEMIAGRAFIIGTSPWGSSPTTKNKTLAVAWDQVDAFYLFDSIDEWMAASKVWESQKVKDSPKKPWF